MQRDDRPEHGPREGEAPAEPPRPAPGSPSHSSHARAKGRVRPNAATAVMARMEAAFAARDLDAVDALLGESMESVDHPTGTAYGREGHLDSSRRMMRLPDLVFRLEPLATFGERLCLLRRLVTASGTAGGNFDVAEYEMEHVGVLELDAVGRCRGFETFAADRLADAVIRLYQRAADALPEGPARTRAAAAAGSIERMFFSLVDRDRLASPFSPAVEWIDRRVAGVGTLRGEAAVLAAVGAFLDLTVDVRWRIDEVLACSADALLTRATNLGTDRAGGGAFERTIHALVVFDADGRVARWESFDLDREAEALARFDEVVGATHAREGEPWVGGDGPAGASPSQELEERFANAATRAMRTFERAWRARDWDGVRATYHPAHRMDDRRRLMHVAVEGEAFLANERLLFDGASSEWRGDLLATRGERLALFRVRFTARGLISEDTGPMEVEVLDLVEVDAVGRRIALTVFDPEALDDALAELERCYEAGEGATHRMHGVGMRAFTTAVVSRDWDPVLALCARSSSSTITAASPCSARRAARRRGCRTSAP